MCYSKYRQPMKLFVHCGSVFLLVTNRLAATFWLPLNSVGSICKTEGTIQWRQMNHHSSWASCFLVTHCPPSNRNEEMLGMCRIWLYTAVGWLWLFCSHILNVALDVTALTNHSQGGAESPLGPRAMLPSLWAWTDILFCCVHQTKQPNKLLS